MECFYYENGQGLEKKNWAFVPLLFQSLEYVSNRFPRSNVVSFTIEHNDLVHAVIHFNKTEEGFVSMDNSPFGGFAAAPDIPESAIWRLVKRVLEKFNTGFIEVYLPFEGYPGSDRNAFARALSEAGFVIRHKDLHQYLPLRDEADMLRHVHVSQRRKLKKCLEAGFDFTEEPHAGLLEIHQFISSCRSRKGLKINISGNDLLAAAQQLPGVYRAFSVRGQEGTIIAACITSHVSEEVLYYYLPGSAATHQGFSPMVMLLMELSKWAYARGYKILDLGKSSLHGELQEGLAVFKRRMGAADGERLCLVYRDS